MKKLKALITAAFDKTGLEALEKIMDVEYHNWLDQGRPYTQEELNKMLKDKDVLIVETCEVHREIIENNKKLKIIGCCRGLRGDDPTIDIEACNQRNIPILFAPGRNLNSVAEHTILLTLALMRKIRPAEEWLYAGKWKKWLDFYTTFRTGELGGRVVGLLGFGNIGRKVSMLFNAFGARVVAYDPYVNDPAVYEKYNVEKVDLETLLKISDVVSVHMNVSDETKHLIGDKELSLMKPTAYLINTARSACVEPNSLYKFLAEKRIAGAAVDVFYHEPACPENEPMLLLDNVFATPHLGGTSNEVIVNHTRIVVEDLIRLLNNEKPDFILNPDVLKQFQLRG